MEWSRDMLSALKQTTLNKCCPLCKKEDNLSKCQGCCVMVYCGREHQVANRPAHKAACNAIKKAQTALAVEEQKLRAQPGDLMTPAGATIFSTHAGHFWGIFETRPYMRARYALVEAQLNVSSPLAVKDALDHLMDMLRLCRGDNMGVRDHVPALFLRLEDDQGCYDFVKWWATVGQQSDYDWGDITLPYLDTKNADVMESPSLFTSPYGEVTRTAAIMLLKFRLIYAFDLLIHTAKDCRANPDPSAQLSPEDVFNDTRNCIFRNYALDHEIYTINTDYKPITKRLQNQVEELYKAVNKQNPHFWHGMLNPEPHLRARPGMYSRGSIEEMQIKLKMCYASWFETPCAIDQVRVLSMKFKV